MGNGFQLRADRPRNARHKLMEIFEGKSVRTFLLLFFLAPSLSAFGKSGSVSTLSAAQNAQVSQRESSTSFKQEPDDLKQELDVDALALSKIPADPIFQRDPLAPIFQPIDKLVDKIAQLERLKFGATYTFLNQYATITPDGVRHNQLSGCLDFTGAWVAYDDGSTAGSISLLVRSGSNIGISQPAGWRSARTDHREHPLLAAGFSREEAFILCGQDTSQRIHKLDHVQ
jgi:hypothetical protein